MTTIHETALIEIRDIASRALLAEDEVTIRLSDGTDQFGQFDKLKPEANRGHHGYREPGVLAGITTAEPIGEHVGDVRPHYHWQVGSTLFGNGLTAKQVRDHGKTTSALGRHNASLFYQSAILDAKTGELLVPDAITIYYKDWDTDEAPLPITDGYRPMSRARWFQGKNIEDIHYFSLIFPNEDEHNIVNPELKFKYKAPNGWRCQTNGRTEDEAFVHGGYIPAQSEEMSAYLRDIATMPASGRPLNRGQALPERFSVDGTRTYRAAQAPLMENWPSIPTLSQ